MNESVKWRPKKQTWFKEKTGLFFWPYCCYGCDAGWRKTTNTDGHTHTHTLPK